LAPLFLCIFTSADRSDIAVGDKYPNTKVVGIDLSPIQPNFVPENVHFFIDDFEDAWVEPEHKYDFIHVRHTLWSVRDRKALYRRALQYVPNLS